LKVAVVSFAADEAWDALFGVKTAKAGTTPVVVGGGALCFLLCSIKLTVGASSIQMKNNFHFTFQSAIKCCNKYFFVVINSNLIFFVSSFFQNHHLFINFIIQCTFRSLSDVYIPYFVLCKYNIQIIFVLHNH
jgi:hypothetical protein